MSKIAEAVNQKKAIAARPKRCKFGQLIDDLPDEEDREALEYAVNAVRLDYDVPQKGRFFTLAWLTKLLQDNDIDMGKTVISEHVRGVCACE